MAVEHVAAAVGEGEPRLLGLAGRVVEADDDLVGVGREDRDIDTGVVRRDAERLGATGARADIRGSLRGDRFVVLHRPAWVDRGSAILSRGSGQAGRQAYLPWAGEIHSVRTPRIVAMQGGCACYVGFQPKSVMHSWPRSPRSRTTPAEDPLSAFRLV